MLSQDYSGNCRGNEKRMNSSKYILLAIIFSLALVGCAKNPKKIEAAYVSPSSYESYDCQTLIQERGFVKEKISNLYAIMKSENKQDKTVTSVGIFLAWPALFFLKGKDKEKIQRYSRLTGELKTIESVMINKDC